MTFAAYCYNAGAENTYLRRLGIAEAPVAGEIEAFITSGEWVDMLREWDSQLITGGSSGLKTTAPLAGFQWEVDDAGGGDSMIKHDLAAVGRQRRAGWLLAYNRGDVEATVALRDWMASTVFPGDRDEPAELHGFIAPVPPAAFSSWMRARSVGGRGKIAGLPIDHRAWRPRSLLPLHQFRDVLLRPSWKKIMSMILGHGIAPICVVPGSKVQRVDLNVVEQTLVLFVLLADFHKRLAAESRGTEAIHEEAVNAGTSPNTPSIVFVTRISLAVTVNASRIRIPSARTTSTFSR